ncbi:uncharacterized protein LOC123900042 [Trifolium pratense]|uniref:Uncharacterized protein n=3 Tax=Trifolium pratense TaxID=57577 RepID=A0ACB0LXP7_TRIPR|nr:uncharacterized protein LOC123900042 [Trifolium pratense]CAJ2673208.1 unnamed protein product [Trifolium pratense]
MGPKYKSVKILSAVEVEEKMEMGLCFVCNEPFTVDHALKHKGIRYKVIEMDEEVERDLSEKFQPEASSEDNNLQIDCHKESVAHDDDTSKVAVNVVDDEFAHFHQSQSVDVISIEPAPIIVDEQEEMVLPAIDISTSSAISFPCYDILSSAKFSPRQVSVDPVSDTIETSHFMSFNQPLSHSVLLTGRDFQPLSHICELPPPPKPPDRVVTPMSSLNLSLLVTTGKHFSILQTSLQLFDEMPKCHITSLTSLPTVWSAIINRCMNNDQFVAFDLFKDMHRMPTTPSDFQEYFDDKHMLCAAWLLEMLNLYESNYENCAESDPIKNFLIEEIKVLKEVKWIGLPNFMLQAAFISLLQRKLQVSTQRACEKLIAKQKNSIQHVMEAVECGKTKGSEYLVLFLKLVFIVLIWRVWLEFRIIHS